MTFTLCPEATQLYYDSDHQCVMFWATEAGTNPKSITHVWQTKQQGYFLFITQSLPNNKDAFYKNLEEKMKGKTPTHPGFGWVGVDDNAPKDPLLLKLNTQGVIETKLKLGLNLSLDAGGDLPLNLILIPGWSLKEHIVESNIVGFTFLYPNNIPHAYPPHPTDGYQLYLSLVDTPGCGRFKWKGALPNNGGFLEFDIQFDPLNPSENQSTFNGVEFKLQPTGATPAYAVKII